MDETTAGGRRKEREEEGTETDGQWTERMSEQRV